MYCFVRKRFLKCIMKSLTWVATFFKKLAEDEADKVVLFYTQDNETTSTPKNLRRKAIKYN